jgi:hypothetical protein
VSANPLLAPCVSVPVSKVEPLSAVAVCSVVSPLRQVTVPPTLTLTGAVVLAINRQRLHRPLRSSSAILRGKNDVDMPSRAPQLEGSIDGDLLELVGTRTGVLLGASGGLVAPVC